MNRTEAKEYIRGNAINILHKDKSGKGYICPICNSGSGKNGTGITTKDGIHFTCWAGCYQNSDIIDIIGKQYGITDDHYKFNKAYEVFGLDIDSGNIEKAKEIKPLQKSANLQAATKPETEDYTAFFLQAHSNINKTDYPQKRGLSKDVIDRFNLGYVEEWQSPKALKEGKKPPKSPRLIIPTSKGSYLARDTRNNLTEEQNRFSKMKEGASELFNTEALKAGKPVFIVEGEIDALSIMEAGGEALALGSTANKDKLLTLLKEQPATQPLLIALDNDKAGEKAAADLAEGLSKLGISFYIADIYGENDKDANEALIADKDAFLEKVRNAEKIANAEREAYKQTSAANHLQDFVNGISASANTPYIPTGFPKFDEILDGGLYEGLYIIGAISSLGKTTLALQIADQIAQQGQDVLIFSLEMARTELMAKSISRLTLVNSLENIFGTGGSTRNAKTARGITTGSRYANYSQQEHELIQTAIKTYSEYAGNIYINEGIGDMGAAEIRETVAKHISFTGKTPVVLIDYLQILAPYNDRGTDKQNTDKAVMELKRISRDFKAAVIGISSFNRQNYNQAVTMEAFKESGAIEYSSDILIGLQLKGAGGKDFDANAAKDKNPREIELVVLKNRNGATGKTLAYEYYPLFNYFREI